MYKVLFIEDDIEYAGVIKRLLESKGMEVDYVKYSTEGLRLLDENTYDLVISDLYLDKFLGTQIFEIMKHNKKDVKFIVISNSVDENDEIKSLKLDTDDFIRKDVSLDIFLERIFKVLRKEKPRIKNEYLSSAVENIEVDPINRVVKKNDEVVKLTILELDLLVFFLSNKNELLSRERIIEDVWKLPADTVSMDLRNIDTHVKNLRKKLSISVITSVRGIGYRWYEE